jgi:hypothetical protein
MCHNTLHIVRANIMTTDLVLSEFQSYCTYYLHNRVYCAMFRIKKATAPDCPLDLDSQEMSDIVVRADEVQSVIGGLFLEWKTPTSTVSTHQRSLIRPPGKIMMFTWEVYYACSYNSH